MVLKQWGLEPELNSSAAPATLNDADSCGSGSATLIWFHFHIFNNNLRFLKQIYNAKYKR
jgi:hypothetical protein